MSKKCVEMSKNKNNKIFFHLPFLTHAANNHRMLIRHRYSNAVFFLTKKKATISNSGVNSFAITLSF